MALKLGPKFGPYALNKEGPYCALYNVWDSWRLQMKGFARLPGPLPKDIAAQTLRANAHEVLFAGTGHFHYMWVSDFAKSLRGAQKALEPAYLRRQIEWMIAESKRLGRVPSCFSAEHGFDMPYYRGDNLPWLIYSIDQHVKWTGDTSLAEVHRDTLQVLIDDYEQAHMSGGLLATSVTGDWMDTILRPSSTYNNLCALRMTFDALALGLKTRTEPGPFARRIIEDRWRKDHFVDFAGTELFSVDAGVLALYLELFDPALREQIVKGLQISGLAQPYPIKVAPKDFDRSLMPILTRLTPKYHSSTWLHLGLMYLNGLKKNGRDVSEALKGIDELTLRYGQMVEAVDEKGELYKTFFHSSEYGLTMAAGQYLELAG